MAVLSKEEVIHIFTHQLPEILDEYPDLEPQLYHVFLKTFARKEEVATLHQDLTGFRKDIPQESKLVSTETR
jgi:hypothetical protein